jgi:hypothetical protein
MVRSGCPRRMSARTEWLTGIFRAPVRHAGRLGHRRQSPGRAGSVATFVVYALLPRYRKVATNGRPEFVDATPNRLPDSAEQSDTARVLLAGASHDPAEVVELLGQVDRYGPAGRVVGFTPIKRRTIIGTTSPARDARIDRLVGRHTIFYAHRRIDPNRPRPRPHERGFPRIGDLPVPITIRPSTTRLQPMVAATLCRRVTTLSIRISFCSPKVEATPQVWRAKGGILKPVGLGDGCHWQPPRIDTTA